MSKLGIKLDPKIIYVPNYEKISNSDIKLGQKNLHTKSKKSIKLKY